MPDPEKNTPDPEHLLKMLDLELATKRQQRLHREKSVQTFRVVGLLVIVGGALFAVAALYFILSQMQQARQQGMEAPPAVVQPGK